MNIRWLINEGKMFFGDSVVDCVCHVRNEENGERVLASKPVISENSDGSEGVPYMPRRFPMGKWNVTVILPKTDPYEAPEFIATDAHQTVERWRTRIGRDGNEIYDQPSGDMVEDYGYGLHNSTSSTTLGCGRIIKTADRALLARTIRQSWESKEPVTLEIT